MIFRDLKNENWILAWDTINCFKIIPSKLGHNFILGIDNQYHNVEEKCKTIFELLSEYQNEEILFSGKSRPMTPSEQSIMLGFAMKKLIMEYSESLNYFNVKIPIIMTKYEISNLYKIKRYNLDRYVIKRLELRELVSRQSKVIYILTEKGLNYINIFIRALKSKPDMSSTGYTTSTVVLQSD